MYKRQMWDFVASLEFHHACVARPISKKELANLKDTNVKEHNKAKSAMDKEDEAAVSTADEADASTTSDDPRVEPEAEGVGAGAQRAAVGAAASGSGSGSGSGGDKSKKGRTGKKGKVR